MASRGAEHAKGHDYLVAEPAAFGRVVRAVVAERFDDNVLAAVRDSGIPYNSLKRYMLGRVSRIRHDSLERVLKFVGRARRSLLERAVLSPAAQARLAAFDMWVTFESQAMASGMTATIKNLVRVGATQRGPRFTREGFVAFNRANEAKSLVHSLRRRFPKEWQRLDHQLQRRGHFNPRGELANLRIVAPLLCHRECGGIERGTDDLSEAELRRFIKDGVNRECILLNREPDLARAIRDRPDPTWSRSDRARGLAP